MVLMSGWIAADALDADKIAPQGVARNMHPTRRFKFAEV